MTLPLLDAIPETVRCRRCQRVCRNGTVSGLGPACARRENVTPPRRPRLRVVASEASEPERTLLDLINEGEEMSGYPLHRGERAARREQIDQAAKIEAMHKANALVGR